MDGGAQVFLVESGDGGQEFRFRLTENRQGVENDPGVSRKPAESFCTAAASVVCLMSSLAHRRRIFPELPNELVQNQRQPVDRSHQLINCLRGESGQLLAAESVGDLTWG